MKKIFFLLSLLISIPLPSHATDINFSLFNINTPEQNKLLNTYSNAYGLPPLQVAPVMSAPAQEIPTILQIAKNAATLPLVVWGLKNQGKSYMDILNTFLLPPSILFNPSVNYDRYGNDYLQAWKYQQQYGSQWPKTIS
ncbi:MAG: hypothetical protein JNK65_00560, partial [Deltaproteobacteria bacterium]|nr:hypothetical protein [Deltaproteobacteria bacterium]